MAPNDTTNVGPVLVQVDETTHSAATALLSVLCFLDNGYIQENLVAESLGPIGLADFPTNITDYVSALNLIISSGKATLETQGRRIIRVPDSVKASVIQALPMDERRFVFDAAVNLLSVGWPWVDTYNATDVERLQNVRQCRPHIVALRTICLDLEPAGFVPGMAFCALLHEEACLEIMQTTVNDMHLGCSEYGLPLAHRILNHHQILLTAPGARDEYRKLCMNQARFVGITASMLGKENEAQAALKMWMDMLTKRCAAHGLRDDARTVAFVHVEQGMHNLRFKDFNDSDAFEIFRKACETVTNEKGTGDAAFKYLLPEVNFALVVAYYHRNVRSAMTALEGLMSEDHQKEDLIIDDITSLETGVVLYAMGKLVHFSATQKRPEVVGEALKFLRRAVTVLEETHGDEAVFTLAATYRMAACLFDLNEYEEAIVHLDKINRALAGYKRTSTDPLCADILWQKARALWKGGKALQALGDESKDAEAEGMLEEASQIHWDVRGTIIDAATAHDSMWDSLVCHLFR